MKVRNKVKAKMANTFKKIIKKHKKKKLQAERNRKAKARERAEENMQMVMSADCPATKEV